MVTTLDVSRTATLAATAVTTSTLLIYIPNVETITLTCFIAGYMYGKRIGIATGIVTTMVWEIIASTLMGGFSGIVFPLKLLVWTLTGVLGAISHDIKVEKHWELAIIGGFLALFFDLVVTIGVTIPLYDSSKKSFLTLYLFYFVQGLPFFTIPHILSNAALFSIIPKIARAMKIVENHYS